MFGELPKIFDRNFLIGYFLPALALVATSLGLVHGRHLLAIAGDPVKLGTFGVVMPLIAAVALLALNRWIFQLFEGYGWCNPFRLLYVFAWIHYKIITCRKERTERKARAAEGKALAKLARKYEGIQSELAERFPPERCPILPTSLGNAMSAFEEYSTEMYGFNAIEGWPRLLAVIPKDYRELIDSSKAETDFWINLWVVGLIVSGDYVLSKLAATFIAKSQMLRTLLPWRAKLTSEILCSVVPIWPEGLLFLFAVLILVWLSARSATRSAIEWGTMVKSSVDVFLPELYSKVGLAPSASTDELKTTWNSFSQAISYRRPDVMPARFGIRNGKKTQPLS